MKFTFILGYKEYLEKTLRAHGNCTLYNARNRGTLIFQCESYFIRIFSLLDSHRARTFFCLILQSFIIIYELLTNGTRADVDLFFSKEHMFYSLLTFAVVQLLVSVGLHGDFIVRKLRKLGKLKSQAGQQNDINIDFVEQGINFRLLRRNYLPEHMTIYYNLQIRQSRSKFCAKKLTIQYWAS